MIDTRFLTGPALILIGALLLTIALRLTLVHPINRVFRVGPFVTERGMKALLNMRIVFYAFGLLLVESGVFRCAYWYVYQDIHHPAVVFLGSLEAGLAVWSAGLAIMAAARLWRIP